MSLRVSLAPPRKCLTSIKQSVPPTARKRIIYDDEPAEQDP